MRTLLVSYVFPPVGGAGVQRVAKLAKYLPAHGISPVVLTAKNPSAPVRDETLAADLPAGLEIVRAPTLEPGYALKALALARTSDRAGGIEGRLARLASSLAFPDPQVLWLPGAMAAIRRLARPAVRPDVALVSAPPFSQLLLVPWIERTLGIPVVVDYRDEWTTTLAVGHERSAGKMASRLAARLERAVLSRAAGVTTATEESRQSLLERFQALDPSRVRFVPNGYDLDDLPERPGLPPVDRFVVSYAGTVFRLTSLRGVLQALEFLHRDSPALARHLELDVYGRIAASEEASFAGSERFGVRRMGYVTHGAALEALAKSHLNLCVLDDVAGAERVYPAKIFELMALGRRCLVLAPPGALERLARRHRLGDVLAPRDAPAIARALAGYLAEWRLARFDSRSSPRDVARYDRRVIAGSVAAILRAVVGRPARSLGPRQVGPEDVAVA